MHFGTCGDDQPVSLIVENSLVDSRRVRPVERLLEQLIDAFGRDVTKRVGLDGQIQRNVQIVDQRQDRVDSFLGTDQDQAVRARVGRHMDRRIHFFHGADRPPRSTFDGGRRSDDVVELRLQRFCFQMPDLAKQMNDLGRRAIDVGDQPLDLFEVDREIGDDQQIGFCDHRHRVGRSGSRFEARKEGPNIGLSTIGLQMPQMEDLGEVLGFGRIAGLALPRVRTHLPQLHDAAFARERIVDQRQTAITERGLQQTEQGAARNLGAPPDDDLAIDVPWKRPLMNDRKTELVVDQSDQRFEIQVLTDSYPDDDRIVDRRRLSADLYTRRGGDQQGRRH
ncbi:MAG TPA: hypothetical protein PLI18_16760 [Pirellulaceae bacterium]|nr:hypothetical protein [Pirellulaceae bacterium]